MLDISNPWENQLRTYVAQCRAAEPLPERADINPAEEWQCQIVGGTILSWLREHGPHFLEQRSVLGTLLDVDDDPAIVFTSNMPGLIAAREILGPDHERVICLLEREFAGSPAQLADPSFKHYLHFWSYFRSELDPQLADEAKAKYPLPPECRYWQHTEGTLWADNAGQEVDHLWCWDGHQPKLLEEAMSSRIY